MDKPPQLDASDMPDIKSLTPEELAAIPFEKWRFFCCIRGCKHFIHVRDYGIWPLLGWRRDRWINVRLQVYFCGQHTLQYRKAPLDMVPFKDVRHVDEIRKTIMEPEPEGGATK